MLLESSPHKLLRSSLEKMFTSFCISLYWNHLIFYFKILQLDHHFKPRFCQREFQKSTNKNRLVIYAMSWIFFLKNPQFLGLSYRVEPFETLCKFCYIMTITLNPFKIVYAWCALQLETLGITRKCIDAIASRVPTHPPIGDNYLIWIFYALVFWHCYASLGELGSNSTSLLMVLLLLICGFSTLPVLFTFLLFVHFRVFKFRMRIGSWFTLYYPCHIVW